MSKTSRRRTGELLRSLFSILMKAPEGVPVSEALKTLADSSTMSEYEQGNYPSTGTRRFETIVRWGTVDCSKAGWILKQRGVWSVTDAGIEAHKKFTDPDAFYAEAVRIYREWRLSTKGEQVDDTASPLSAEEEITVTSAAITYEQAEEQSWQEIEKYLATMQPYEVQELFADLLRAMDYHVSWIAPPGRDGGIDILAGNDPLGTKPPRIKVQVKRQIQKVAVDGLRSFISLIGDKDVGVFFCTGGFTRDAEEHARQQENRTITLIDLDKFIDLWVKNHHKLDDKARQRLPLRPIWFLTL